MNLQIPRKVLDQYLSDKEMIDLKIQEFETAIEDGKRKEFYEKNLGFFDYLLSVSESINSIMEEIPCE